MCQLWLPILHILCETAFVLPPLIGQALVEYTCAELYLHHVLDGAVACHVAFSCFTSDLCFELTPVRVC